MKHHYTEIFEDAGVPLMRLPESRSLIQRHIDAVSHLGLAEEIESINRGDYGGDAEKAIAAIIQQINRGVTSTMTAFPVRENLQAEAVVLTPVRTPLRNRLPRVPGMGLAAKWKQLTSFGSGLGTLTSTNGVLNTANTIKVNNTRGFFVGETVTYNGTVPFTAVITAIDNATNVMTFGGGTIGLNAQENGKTVVKASYFFPEQGVASNIFYTETGAPGVSTESWADKTASYKLLGDMGNITLFAMAAGANFQNQYATAKQNCLMRTMLKEEYALLHGDSTVLAAPWGDGATAMAYDGLITFITANAPAPQLQSSVGALTLEHLQQQLTRLWYQGAEGMYIMLNGQEGESLTKLATASGNYRVLITNDGAMKVGGKVGFIVHAISGEEVPIYTHPFLPPGMIVFGADRNQKGNASAIVDVLPQVMDQPETTFNDNIQGYYAQDIAPTAAAPEVLNFKIGLYSVPKWENAKVFALSTGVTRA